MLATIDPKAGDALEQLAKKAGGPIRAVIDLVGNAAATQLGFDCLTKGGKLVIVGLFCGGATWALPLIPIKAVTIQGSYVGNVKELRALIDIAKKGLIPAIPVENTPQQNADAVLHRLKEGKITGRVVLVAQ